MPEDPGDDDSFERTYRERRTASHILEEMSRWCRGASCLRAGGAALSPSLGWAAAGGGVGANARIYFLQQWPTCRDRGGEKAM